jgi:hypothetical protein
MAKGTEGVSLLLDEVIVRRETSGASASCCWEGAP